MVRILDSVTVGSLLTVQGVLEAMRDLFALAADPGTVGYDRFNFAHPAGWVRALPGYIVPMNVMGFKVLHGTDGVGARFAIYVHDLASGELIGIVDGLEVSTLRTGAVSAVATEHLALEDVGVAALIGTGPIARGQLQAVDLVRPATEIRVFSPTPSNRQRFIDALAPSVGSRLVEAGSLEEAIEGADVVTLATKAVEPLLTADHLSPGLHVNSVGPAARERLEIDPGAFGAFDRVVCDSVDLVMDQAGDACRAVAGGHFEAGRADELSAVVSGSRPGRSAPDQVTLFKSVGTGLQDLMVAARLLEEAAARDAGTVVDDFIAVKRAGGAPGMGP